MKERLGKLLANDFVIVLIIALAFYGFYRYFDSRISTLKEIESSYKKADAEMERKLSELEKAVIDTLAALENEEENNSALRQRLNDIRDTVGELEKLSNTDPELLQKYSKVYFLNEHYVPVSLSDIPEEYRSSKSTNYQIHSDVLPHLEDLMEEAEEDGVSLLVQSAYRSFATQTQLKSTYTVTYGSGANRFSADQGYSEHQLGTTVDFTTEATAGALSGFDQTPEYAWLLDNAHRYGFILSYPSGNAYYKFEPWHWRYVGIDLARDLHKQDMYFYDMDQREIDTYLGKIFD